MSSGPCKPSPGGVIGRSRAFARHAPCFLAGLGFRALVRVPGGPAPTAGRATSGASLEGWDYMRVNRAELRETGTGAYLVRGKHSTTESEIVEPYEQHLEFHDGLLSRARMVFGS